MINVDEETCRNLDESLAREWLETNGLGGFASSTIAGANTRRYHALLTAATKPPVGRVVMLSKLEETFVAGNNRYDLSTNQYPGAVHPQGYQLQSSFRLDPFPISTYHAHGIEIEKAVFMVNGENTTVIQYDFRRSNNTELEGLDANLSFEIRPLIAFRDYHSTTHENSALNSNIEFEDGRAKVAPYPDLPALYVAFGKAELLNEGSWYRNFEYRVEQERGLEFREDLFNPFTLIFRFDRSALTKGVRLSIVSSTERHDVKDANHYRAAEIDRRAQISSSAVVDNELVRTLTVAADQFVVDRGEQKTIVAGYHWFADWGRDTMIALPGLTLVTGRYEIAKSVLLEFAKHVDRGMLPNRFPDAGEQPEYNTVDATLWFFEAVRALFRYSGDYQFVHEHLYEVLRDIVNQHVRGTRYNIHVDADGLLFSGEPGVQLTWMDAKVGDWVVTPRTGKPVEIQALWYNSLRVMEKFAERFGDFANQKLYKAMAVRARKSFNEQFWNQETGCLYDVVNDNDRDASIRPNQIFAVSLENSLVSKTRAKSILGVVERELLTPRGLRTLSPGDARYVGRYLGDPRTRDGSYHQGTVWPWLMGGYMSAYAKTYGLKAGRQFISKWVSSFVEHFNEGCLGQVSEIFDADAPHASRGCVAQAWSVAEVLRAAVECGYTTEDKSSKQNASRSPRASSLVATAS